MTEGVKIFLLLVACSMCFNLNGELVHRSRLKKDKGTVNVKRDIFRFSNGAPARIMPVERLQEIAEQKAKEKAESEEAQGALNEVASIFVYEGYVANKGKLMALISIDGEYYVVSEKEQILDEVKVVGITDKSITIQARDKKMEIELKGGEEQ